MSRISIIMYIVLYLITGHESTDNNHDARVCPQSKSFETALNLRSLSAIGYGLEFNVGCSKFGQRSVYHAVIPNLMLLLTIFVKL